VGKCWFLFGSPGVPTRERDTDRDMMSLMLIYNSVRAS